MSVDSIDRDPLLGNLKFFILFFVLEVAYGQISLCVLSIDAREEDLREVGTYP